MTLITSGGCHYCEHARDVLARVGIDYPIEVTEIALDSDEGMAAQRRWRAPFPPLLLIGDQLFGFGRISERKLRRAFDGAGA